MVPPAPREEMTTRDTSQQLIELNEDCLALNMWTQELDDDRRPVMVWLLGRGFYAGAGSEYLYDGPTLRPVAMSSWLR